jgi:hypothetical protein
MKVKRKEALESIVITEHRAWRNWFWAKMGGIRRSEKTK